MDAAYSRDIACITSGQSFGGSVVALSSVSDGARVCATRSVKSLQDDGQLKTLLNAQYGPGSISTARQRL